MNLAIIGSREMNDEELFKKGLAQAIELWGTPQEVVSGGARGADTLGERWARKHGIPVRVFKPDWLRHGKAAGPIRNRDIITHATHVVAFPSRKGKGTQHAMKLAEKEDKKLLVYWID